MLTRMTSCISVRANVCQWRREPISKQQLDVGLRPQSRMLNPVPGLNHFQVFTQETRQMTASDVLSTEGLQSGMLEQMRAWAFVKTRTLTFTTIRETLCVPA